MKIFINGMDGVGAFVLYDPLLKNLKRAFPESKIAMACWRITRDLVKSHPLVDVYFCYEDMAGLDGPEEIFHSYIKRLAPFDVALDLGNPPLSMRVIASSGAGKRIGLKRNDEEYNSFLTDPVTLHPDRHMSRNYLDMTRCLGVDPLFTPPELWISEEDARRAFEKFGDREFLSPGKFVVGVVHGAGSVYKRWPKGRFADLIDLLKAKYDVEVLLFGTERIRLVEAKKRDADETEVAAWIERKTRHPGVIDLSKGVGIGELAVLIDRCDLVVSNDTGPMHMAAAIKTPVVGIFGPTDPKVWGPLGETSAAVTARIPCSPCTPAGCPKNVCLQSITPEEVLEAVESLGLDIPPGGIAREPMESRKGLSPPAR